jgi:NADPH:quinone reductase-like Zn-dependent oxidoreductase
VRAIVLEKFGGLDSVVFKDIPDPEPPLVFVLLGERVALSLGDGDACSGART